MPTLYAGRPYFTGSGPFAQADDEVVVGFRIVGGPCAATVAVITAPAAWGIVDGANEGVLAVRSSHLFVGCCWTTTTLTEVAEVVKRALAHNRDQQGSEEEQRQDQTFENS